MWVYKEGCFSRSECLYRHGLHRGEGNGWGFTSRLSVLTLQHHNHFWQKSVTPVMSDGRSQPAAWRVNSDRSLVGFGLVHSASECVCVWRSEWLLAYLRVPRRPEINTSSALKLAVFNGCNQILMSSCYVWQRSCSWTNCCLDRRRNSEIIYHVPFLSRKHLFPRGL